MFATSDTLSAIEPGASIPLVWYPKRIKSVVFTRTATDV